MKHLFIDAVVLIVVWAVARGLTAYWENHVMGYYQVGMDDICRNYNGHGDYVHDVNGEVKFVCIIKEANKQVKAL